MQLHWGISEVVCYDNCNAGQWRLKTANHISEPSTFNPGQVNKHTSALEEVQRRLKLVNKGLDHRLEQTKSELRQYNNDSREMTTMSREVDASREVRTFVALGSGFGNNSVGLLHQKLV